jgi:preprotein translocase subunit SecE
MSIFAHKSKKLRYAISGFGIVTSVYMLVIALAKEAWSFVDVRPLPDVTRVDYTSFVLIAAIAILVFTILAIAYLLIDDYIEVAESKGAKLTIPKRIVRFFRDYKSEVKKIVWPGYKDVIKNTVIVLIMCLIIGLLIWAVDFGLGQLVQLILGTKS